MIVGAIKEVIFDTMNILDAIGNTPLIELKRVAPLDAARIVAKLEWANPTGSMKDRMARAAIEGAEARRELSPGGTVVEYTGESLVHSRARIDKASTGVFGRVLPAQTPLIFP